MRRRFAASGIIFAALVPVGAVLATAPPSSPPGTDSAGTAPADTAPADTDAAGTAPADTSAETTTAGTDPASTGDEPTATTTAEDPGASPVATIFNEERAPVAEVAVAGMEPGWTDYSEDDAPDEGREYFRMTVTVQSLATDENTFGISVGDFILQDSQGFLDDADTVRSAAEVESDEEVTEEADLASGESVDLTLTFELDASADPQSVFYSSDDPERLVLVGDVTA